jgi:hypothetical protein
MTSIGWIVIGGGFLCALFLLGMALCAVAKDADEALDRHYDEQLADVAHLGEARHRRDVRNGLGRAS